MAVELAPGWMCAVDRGPDWLFVRPTLPKKGNTEEIDLADAVYDLMQQHFAHRVVIELYDLAMLRSWLVGQLVHLHKRVTANGGTMRLCGLSDSNQEVLRTCRLEDCFPQYADRAAAVMGCRPTKPR